jgi:steroid delta-isomerase-like uncharacterized protein
MPSSSADLMQALADAFNSRDFDRIPDLVNENADFEDVAAGEVIHGASGLRDYMRMWAGAFSDMRLDTLAIVGDDRHVAGEFRARGTHDGPFASPDGEIPATNRTMEERFTWFGEVDGGKLAGVRDYYNAMSMMTQLGLMPEAAAETS